MAAIGAAAAETESFALYYVNSTIGEVSRDLLWLILHLGREQIEPTSESTAQEAWERKRFADELLTKLEWLAGSVHWRIFKAFPTTIKTRLVWDFFSTLSDIGIRALNANLEPIADAVIQQLGSLAAKSIEKPIGANIAAPAEIAVYIARIGIVALKDKRKPRHKRL